MLFRNFHNLNRLFRDFDDLFFENPTLKGKEKIQTGIDEDGEWEKRSFVSDSGLFSYSFITRKSNKPHKTNEIESLKQNYQIINHILNFCQSVSYIL